MLLETVVINSNSLIIGGWVAGSNNRPEANAIPQINDYCIRHFDNSSRIIKRAKATEDVISILAANSGAMSGAAYCALAALVTDTQLAGLRVAGWVERVGYFAYESTANYPIDQSARRERAKQYLRWALANGAEQAGRLLKNYQAAEAAAEPTPITCSVEVMRASAEDLHAAFEGNQALFFKTYGGKTIEVRGLVQTVGEDSFTIDTNPREKDSWKRGLSSFMTCAPAASNDKFLNLAKGRMATVVGVIQRSASLPNLKWDFAACEIVATK